MNRTVARAALAAAALVLLAGTAGCGGSDITSGRLERALGPTFRNLFALQQTELHGTDNAPSPDTWANCAKAGRASGGSGPGDDWVCLVHWPAPSGITQPIAYEVSVRPTGCYTAQGPATLVGQQRIQGADGHQHTNPLYEFDGCFDTA
ncbi:hypothetical protein [Streptomyces silvisoli]|uniref:LppP/LprE family lipoprotein n=1 Tax=Streptomyces silvisoli TaxID=3034235 RepID=A0ABT5ZUX4_9ACTN|nr:hypothetical protein [Streptomyces silvisoli]MDF3293546.1 hypothetical protein [Streptomyces silvisoli]